MEANGSRHLGINLNDHLAGSMTAIELVQRAAEQYKGTQLGEFFAAIGAEIEAQRIAAGKRALSPARAA